MLNTNLSYQSLHAFTKIYVSIAEFGQLWTSFCQIVSYTKGCVPYEGECIV